MTREEAKKLLPILQAYADGKKLQYYNCGEWTDVKDGEDLSLINYPKKYRIKPTPTYRPFNNAGECWQEMLQHEPFGWIKEESRDYGTILRSLMFINYTECCFGLGYRKTFADGFQCFTFADGTPFGVAMEEQP